MVDIIRRSFWLLITMGTEHISCRKQQDSPSVVNLYATWLTHTHTVQARQESEKMCA